MKIERRQLEESMGPGEREQLRDRAEAAARERHPGASEVNVNASHLDGPVVEVYGDGPPHSYRYTGWEL